MLVNEQMYAKFISIMVASINMHGKVDAAWVCDKIAQHIDSLGRVAYEVTLTEFVEEYGESLDSIYMGRDADGEKQYEDVNLETCWTERVRKKLAELDYYERNGLNFTITSVAA